MAFAASLSASAAGDLEGHVGGVDRVRLAVDQRHPQVHDRVAGGDALVHLGPQALLHRRDELTWDRRRRRPCRRTRSPPRASGSTSMSQIANCPCPPDCLTCRPWPWPARRTSPAAGPAGHRARPRRRTWSCSRSSRTSTCASPMHHSTSWPVSACSPAATSGPRRRAGRPGRQLVLVRLGLGARSPPGAAARACSTARSAAGRPWRTACRPVSAETSLATAQMSPARHSEHRCAGSCPAGGQRADASRRRRGPGGRARRDRARTRARGRSGRSVPANTRTTEMRPTYGSVVVLITSATQRTVGVAGQRRAAWPSGRVTTGTRARAVTGSPR